MSAARSSPPDPGAVGSRPVIPGFSNKLALLRHGLDLDQRALRPAQVELVGRQQLKFILQEGRNRQIRRMCELVELTVVDLLRIRIGDLVLGDLPEGRCRPRTTTERASLVASPR